jgi:hypothetical protein
MGNPSASGGNKNVSNISTASAAVTHVRPPLDVYKKLSIIFKSTDNVVYETIFAPQTNLNSATSTEAVTSPSSSAPQTEIKCVPVGELGEVALTAAPLLQPKPKINIPVPQIDNVEDYEHNLSPDYDIPTSFVRHIKPQSSHKVAYTADLEDEVCAV